MSTLAIASAVVAKKALEKVVSDIYDYCADELKTSVQRWKTQAHIEILYKKLKNIRYVKTVWQFEREVDLLKFYYPTKIIVDKKPVIVSELDDFPYQGNSLIQGTVGRGKSIFLRYLTATELVQGRSIPLFIELRRIRESQTLLDHLLQEMNVLGLAISEKGFRKICDEGKIILLLDAFDEIRETQRAAFFQK